MTTALGNSSISYLCKELSAHSYCFCAHLRSSGEEVWRCQSQHMLTPNCMSNRVIQETDARLGKCVKHAGSSALHSLFHSSLAVFQLVTTSDFLGKPHRGWEKVQTHSHNLSHGVTSQRRALIRKPGPCRTFGHDKGFFFFFFIGEGNGETQGLCQEGMNRQPWKSWDKDY